MYTSTRDNNGNEISVRHENGKTVDIHIRTDDGKFIWLDGNGETVKACQERAARRIWIYEGKRK